MKFLIHSQLLVQPQVGVDRVPHLHHPVKVETFEDNFPGNQNEADDVGAADLKLGDVTCR